MKDEEITYRIGIDVGSTTFKMMVLDSADKVIYKSYIRHKANINQVFAEELKQVEGRFSGARFRMKMTGSAGMGLSERLEIPFIQEVIASVEVVRKRYPNIHTMIDLGGEDTKIAFFDEGKHPDIRMNGSSAGGTGSFIDQMADLMNIPVESLGAEA